MSYAERVFKIIAENPGINGGEIARMINSESDQGFTIKTLNSVLNGLKRRTFNSVENRGSNGLSARWYVVEPQDPEPMPYLPYLDEARRILREMKRIIPNQRAEWLAEQLQALID